jgi:signal transduction histidine kinase
MSHELRTPLTSILAFTELWEHPQMLGDDEARVIKEIQANGQILLNMVDNILEMARMEAGRVELMLEPVDMVDLISTTEKTLHALAARRDIQLNTAVSTEVPLINADWEKLRRIIVNLASNAIKFTKKGGLVNISVTCPESKDALVIKVSDSGKGIPQEDLKLIFERFTQSDQSSMKRYSGSGLGLAVVRELVEMMDGTIEVDSELKVGSTFTITIPLTDKDWVES